MSLHTGTNQIKIQVIDNDTGEVKAELNQFCLDYAQTVLVEEALVNALLDLSKARLNAATN